MDFKAAEALFKNEELNTLAATTEGAKYLRLRSLNRSKYLLDFLKKNEVDTENLKVKNQLAAAYKLDITLDDIDKFIKENYKLE